MISGTDNLQKTCIMIILGGVWDGGTGGIMEVSICVVYINYMDNIFVGLIVDFSLTHTRVKRPLTTGGER